MVKRLSRASGLAAACALSLLGSHAAGTAAPQDSATGPAPSPQAVVSRTCVGCHNDRARSGNLSLASFEVATAASHRDVTERMIRKLRAGQMPPAGIPRDEAALAGLAAALEAGADAHVGDAAAGRRTFQGLNRAEYERSVHDLLVLAPAVDAGAYLPLDPKSANFDNIADAQLLSPTLMQSYLTAAAEISRLAVGDRAATAREATYSLSRWVSQREHIDGAPYGTRGG